MLQTRAVSKLDSKAVGFLSGFTTALLGLLLLNSSPGCVSVEVVRGEGAIDPYFLVWNELHRADHHTSKCYYSLTHDDRGCLCLINKSVAFLDN